MASVSTSKRPRRFAPLNPDVKNENGDPVLKGIIFDVDGTLCLPQNYMFAEMRQALSIPRSIDILDHINSLSNNPDSSSPTSASPRSRAQEAIRAIERRAMTSQQPQPGLVELMAYLTKRGVRKALCTRNFEAPVQHLLGKFLAREELVGVFGPVVTRETVGVRPKPHPEGLWFIAGEWGLGRDGEGEREGEEGAGEVDGERGEMEKRWLGEGLIMVGDSVDDMTAGRRAGAATVLLVNEENKHLEGEDVTDLGIRRLDELVEVLERGFLGRK